MAASVRILQMPDDVRLSMVFIGPDKASRVKALLDRYLVLPPMPVSETDEGEDLAEEMFDLTNNPSRQAERMERYGNGRSLSTGDVVRTLQGDFLCCSMGWVQL